MIHISLSFIGGGENLRAGLRLQDPVADPENIMSGGTLCKKLQNLKIIPSNINKY
jgi:hypothetical protein